MSMSVNDEDYEFESKLFQSSLGYTLFNNGYLNWRTGIFTETGHDLFDDEIYFNEIIPYDFTLGPMLVRKKPYASKTIWLISNSSCSTPPLGMKWANITF